MPQCRITVEYDGTGYHGWQVQDNARSVQAELERALELLTGREIRVRGAGRTDAGVHARGQTAAFPMPESIPLEKIPAALNSRLPGDIAVIGAKLEDDLFDPRRHCLMKQYSYSITAGQVRPALADRRSWHVKWPLDIDAMRRAAAKFAGDHDFTSFANRERAGEDNLRTVERSELAPLEPDPAGRPRYVYYVEGRSFLYNMVRAIAGTLVAVGSGRFALGDIEEIFAARDRARAGQSAPPWGLCLEWALYRGDERPPDRGGLF